MEKDIAIGSVGSASVAQEQGKLSVKAQVSQPISVGGAVIGSVAGDVIVSLDELAVLQALADKYASNAIVKAGIDVLAGAIKAIG